LTALRAFGNAHAFPCRLVSFLLAALGAGVHWKTLCHAALDTLSDITVRGVSTLTCFTRLTTLTCFPSLVHVSRRSVVVIGREATTEKECGTARQCERYLYGMMKSACVLI